jgi:hypothetical protein
MAEIDDILEKDRKKALARKKRKQGGLGGANNTAGLGARLGGDPAAVRARAPVTTKLGDRSSVTTSPEAADRISGRTKSGGSLTTGFTFNGGSDADRAELNAIRSGKASGLTPDQILRGAEQAKANATKGTEGELARLQLQRDNGEVDPAVFQARFTQLSKIRNQEIDIANDRFKTETNAELSNSSEDNKLRIQTAKTLAKQTDKEKKESAKAARDLALSTARGAKEDLAKTKALGVSRRKTQSLLAGFKNSLSKQGRTLEDEPEAQRELARNVVQLETVKLAEILETSRSGPKGAGKAAMDEFIAEFKLRGITLTPDDIRPFLIEEASK